MANEIQISWRIRGTVGELEIDEGQSFFADLNSVNHSPGFMTTTTELQPIDVTDEVTAAGWAIFWNLSDEEPIEILAANEYSQYSKAFKLSPGASQIVELGNEFWAARSMGANAGLKWIVFDRA